MAGTRAGAIRRWHRELERKAARGDSVWQDKLDAFKRKHNQELVDILNADWQKHTKSKESPYWLDDTTLEVDGAAYTTYVEDGVPPGGQVMDSRIKEWIIKVKHPDIDFFESKASRRELDRIAYRIESKIRREGIKPRPHRAAAVEKLRRKYNNVRFGVRGNL